MKKFLIKLFVFAILILSTNAISDTVPTCNGKLILGPIEKVILLDKNLMLTAKLDTGAAGSSLSATEIKTFEYQNKTWIRFTLDLPNKKEKMVFIKPVFNYVHILKRSEELTTKANSAREYSTRPVIALPIQLGTTKKIIFVSLIDRTQFRYALLLGRDDLKSFNILIDVNK